MRPPKSAQRTFQSLECVLDLKKWYCNLFISYEDRTVFIERTSNLVEGVIFVGALKNITKVRRMYPSDILFLANGSGHNPVVIGKNANLDKAIQSVLNVTLYNQGQDCCGPNTILVDSELLEQFMIKLLAKIKLIEPFVGSSEDDCVVVSPNTDKSHTIAIAKTFVNNSEYHVHGGDINPITGLIKPTVFLKQLSDGANYEEFFAPVFFVQPYENRHELRNYFFLTNIAQTRCTSQCMGDLSSLPS